LEVSSFLFRCTDLAVGKAHPGLLAEDFAKETIEYTGREDNIIN